MTIVSCQPATADAANLPVVHSIIARFHPAISVRIEQDCLTLESEVVTADHLERVFLAASLTARMSEQSRGLRLEVWSRLLR